MPYYILHWVPLAPLAFYMIQLDWGILPKFALIFTGAVAGPLALCWYVVWPYNVLRILYGMRLLSLLVKNREAVSPSVADPQHS